MKITAALEADAVSSDSRDVSSGLAVAQAAESANRRTTAAPWRSLKFRFLLITLSSVLIIIVTFFTYLEVSQYRVERHQITEKLGRMLDSGSILLADATASRRDDEVRLLLALLLGDPDVVSVALDLKDGTHLVSFGEDPEKIAQDMILRRSIVHIERGTPVRIGTIRVGITHNRIDAELEERLRNHVILALLIIGAIGIGSYLSLRVAVMQPLQKLLSAIEGWRIDKTMASVDWSRNDEFGQLIASFNQMQLRQRYYQEELRIALGAAKSADRAKTAFLAIIGHELRTPLNSVIGFSDLLKAKIGGSEGGEVDEYLGHITASGQGLLEMVNDILEITHAQAGTLALTTGQVSLPAFVETVIADCRRRRDEETANVENTIPDTLPVVEVDAKRLGRMLSHLVANALRFTPADSTIRVSAVAGPGGVEIQVTDSGCGIPADRLIELHQPFSQMSADWQTHSEGAGLGLAYVKTLAEFVGGDFRLESIVGEGTTAVVTIPA